MNSNFNIERKEKNQFRVKFTHQDQKKKILNNKQMILGTRARNAREFNGIPSGSSIKTKQIDCESDADSNTSKRELKVEIISATLKAIQYTQFNTSVIIGGFDILSSFFQEQVSFKLIFRASNHKFSVKAFHQICDAYEDTVTLCLTEDNKIIGGYTPLTWQDQFNKNSTHFKTDFKRQTFIFSVSDIVKYPLVKSLKNKAICCFKSYGPTFGGGYDLLIGDKSNQIPNTTSYFPRNFEHPNPNNFNKRDFTGTSRKNFKLQQWQVFHVIKLYSLKTVENANFTQLNESKETKNQKSYYQKFKTAAKDFFKGIFSDN